MPNRNKLGKKGSFETKNRTAWNKGLTKETDERIKRHSEILIGRKMSEETKKKLSDALKGKKHSKERKQKMSIIRKKIWNTPKYRQIAREMRSKQVCPKKDTKIELKIQDYLKQLRVDFFTHHYFHQINHAYQCDIFIPAMDLVIECDGDYWHKYPIGRDIDLIRTKELIEKGFKVLRLWEREIEVMTLEEFKNKL